MSRAGATQPARVLAWASLVLLVDCSPFSPPEPAPVRPPLTVEVAGCAELLRGPRCRLGASPEARALTLWVDLSEATPLSLRVDGRPPTTPPVSPPPPRTAGRGQRLTVEVPPGARLLTASVDPDHEHVDWSLPLDPPQRCPALERAGELRERGEAEAAHAALDEARPGMAQGCRGGAWALRGRLLLDADQPEAALEALRKAVTLRGASGDISGQVDDGLAMAWILTHAVRDLGGARAALRFVRAVVDGYGPGLARLPYYEGRLALESGDLRAAMGRFEEAARRAERLGMARLQLHAAQSRSEVLAGLGRHEEAAAALQSLDQLALGACDRAALANNLGWVRLLAGRGEEAVEPLRQAVALYTEGCAKGARRANARVNLALASLAGGEIDAAEAALALARGDDERPDPRIADWMVVVQGRIGEARGQWERALAVWRGLAGEAPELSDARWRAWLGEARALEALGRVEEAVAALRRAEEAVDAALRLVPLGEGRASYVGERDEAARRLVALLVAMGQDAEAAVAARRSLARVMATLARVARVPALQPAQREAFERALAEFRRARARVDGARLDLRTAALDEQDALERHRAAMERDARVALDAAYAALEAPHVQGWSPAAPAPGVLRLVFYPGTDGLTGFGITARQTRAVALGPVEPGAPAARLAETLLAPFDSELAAATRIELTVPGSLRAVDLHALPWRGRPLLAHAPVTWALDLPTSTPAPRPAAALALVVSDPQGNLPAARRDGAVAVAAIGGWPGWRVAQLAGRQASREAVLRALPGAELLHYAGHALFDGAAGWGSALGLARGGRLSVADVLGLRDTPRRVVLSGCETARSAATAQATALGLGQAFVAAGAEQVVASSRVVDDDEAGRLSQALFAAPLEDAPAALRRAQLALARECPDCDWAAWRALTP